MGQQEINDFLKKNPDRWFRSVEIAKAIGTETPTTINCLRKMRHYKDVIFKLDSSENNLVYLYQYKK